MAQLPEELGPYRILEKIGQGGMGVVYKALDTRLNRHVAVKSLWPSFAAEEGPRERFLREAQSAAAISHPNVAQIYDIGETLGQVWFAMEFLSGPSLLDRMKEDGPIPAAQAVDLMIQAASGLKAAADKGIVHRDVKPGNLVFADDGSLKVTDFGLAKEELVDSGLTASGTLVGTPHYISPEAAQGEPVDIRSDIYALGITLFEMVSGAPPFSGPTSAAVLIKHIREPVPPLRSLHPELPYPLVALIQRMLAKRPAARPQSYDELIEQLERLRSGAMGQDPGRTRVMTGVQAPGFKPIPMPEPEAASGGAARWITTAGVVVAAGILGWVLFGRDDRPPAAGEPAQTARQAAEPRPELQPAAQPPAGRPRSAAEPPPQFVPFATNPAELKVTDAGHEITADGELRVAGEVQNFGDSRATAIKMHITLIDDSGQVIDERTVPVAPVRVGPGETGVYEARFPDPEQNVRIELELNWVS